MVTDIHTHNAHTQAQTIETVGVHPWHALTGEVSEVARLAPEVDAVGEIGLDYACDVPREVQMTVFRAQLALAERHKKAVVLHCVRAFEPMMKILSEYELRAVIFHGFIGSVQQAERAIKQGYYLSFGEAAFRSPRTVEALRAIPLSRLFAETDESPLSIKTIYETIASERKTEVATLQTQIENNYNEIFLQHNDR